MFGLFKSKKSREIDEFAVNLARDFASRCPHSNATPPAEQVARAIDETCNRAAAYQREQKLGIYQRASLGTSFKFELKERGYPKEFIDTLTAQLLLSMSGK